MAGIPRLIHAEKDRVYQLIIELATALITAQPDDVLEYSLKYLRGKVASKKAPRVLIYCEHSATADELARLIAVRSGLMHITRENLRRIVQHEEQSKTHCICYKCDIRILRCAAAVLKNVAFQTKGYATAGLPWDGDEVDALESQLVRFTHLIHVTGIPRERQMKLPLCPRHQPTFSDYKKRLKSLLKHFESKVIITIPVGKMCLAALATECQKQIFADTLISPFYRVKWKPRVVIFGAQLARPEWFAERLCRQYGLVYVDMEALVLLQPPERRACANRVELVEARVRDWDCVMAGWVLVGGPKDAEEMSRLDSSCCKPNRVFLMKADIDWLLYRVDGGRFFRKHEGTTYKTYYGEAKARPAIFQETFGYLDRLKAMQWYCGPSAVSLDCEKALQERYKDMVLQLQLAPPEAPMRTGVAPRTSDVGLGDYTAKLNDYAPAWAPQLHDAPSTDTVVFSSTEMMIISSDQGEEALKESPEHLPPQLPCVRTHPNLDDSIRVLVEDLRENYGENGNLFKLALQRKLIPQLHMLMDKLRLSAGAQGLLSLFPLELQHLTSRIPICEELSTPHHMAGEWIPRDSRPRPFSVEAQPPSPRKVTSRTGGEGLARSAAKLVTPLYHPRAEGTQERREMAERLKEQRMPPETSGFPLTTLKTRLRRMGKEYVPDKPQPPASSRQVRAEQEFWYLSSPYYVSNRNVLFSVYNKVVGGTDYISEALARQIAPLGPLGQPCLTQMAHCVVSQSFSNTSETGVVPEEEIHEDETAAKKGEQRPCNECVITYEREHQRPLEEEHHPPYRQPKYITERTQDIVSHVGQHRKPFIPNSEAFYPALTGDEPVISSRLPARHLQKPTAPQMSTVLPAEPEPRLALTYRRFAKEPIHSIHYVVPPEGICTARCLPRDDSRKIRPDKIEDVLENLPTELAPRKLELDIKRIDIVRYEISK